MVVEYLIAAAGIGAGAVKSLPDSLAAELIRLGVAKEAVCAASKPVADKVTEPTAKAAKTAPKRAKNAKK